MLFTNTLTVPANTPATSPASLDMTLAPGVVRRAWIEWKTGCAWRVHIRVMRELTQVLPVTPDESLNFDGYVFDCALNYEMVETPYELQIYGWSPGSIYAHTIRVMMEVEIGDNVDWDALLESMFVGGAAYEGGE